MSKIVCEYDSVDKTFTVTVDGKELNNVDYFSCCSKNEYYDGYCSITQCIHDKDNDVKTTMNTMAVHSPEGKKAVEAGHRTDFLIPGFVTFPGKNPVHGEILKYFERK